jgi:hypothetical protein
MIALGTLIRIIPPWMLGVALTLLGHWGEKRWFAEPARSTRAGHFWNNISFILITNLVFLAIIPTLVLDFIQPMIPFTGARAGLAVAMAGYVFGLVPARLADASRIGWDHAFWLLLVDFLRLGGALTLIGWLLTS